MTDDFRNGTTKIKIGCPRHGIVETTALCHLKYKDGCPKCLRYDANEIEEIFYKNPHNHNLSFYNLVEDLDGEVKVRFLRIVCLEHGQYKTRISGVLRGNGCLKCYHSRCKGIYNKTIADRNIESYSKINLFIYLLWLSDLNCYKLGLTNNLSRRLSQLKYEINTPVTVKYLGIGSAYDMILLEESLLDSLTGFRHESSIKFGGHTELLNLDDDLCSDLIEFLASQTEEQNTEEIYNGR